jgi:hypothetical protein
MACDVLVKVRNHYVPTDFVVLDMGNREDTPLILGRPFLNTVNACIYMSAGRICFNFPGRTENFPFSRRPSNLSQAKQPKRKGTKKPEQGKQKPKQDHKQGELSSTASSPTLSKDVKEKPTKEDKPKREPIIEEWSSKPAIPWGTDTSNGIPLIYAASSPKYRREKYVEKLRKTEKAAKETATAEPPDTLKESAPTTPEEPKEEAPARENP